MKARLLLEFEFSESEIIPRFLMFLISNNELYVPLVSWFHSSHSDEILYTFLCVIQCYTEDDFILMGDTVQSH